MTLFRKVMVANRGEIAIRVFRTLREMGIPSVAVYSEVDRDALFVSHADEAYLLGPGPAAESYLNVPRILEVAAQAGVDAVHPGYGFLAENAGFARALAEAGIVWIGPPPERDRRDGLQGAVARADGRGRRADRPRRHRAGGRRRGRAADRRARSATRWPSRRAAGGGGKGFRVALDADELEGAFARRRGRGRSASSPTATVYLERYLPDPRHVEIQILADTHGSRASGSASATARCSAATRSCRGDAEPGRVATTCARAWARRRCGRRRPSATPPPARSSTWSRGEEFFFLEMNTRIQVEHTITEAVTGLDLVREQIRVAAGEPLSMTQDQVSPRGHAFECRINAEDASAALHALPRPDHRLPRALGPGRAGRLGRARGLR